MSMVLGHTRKLGKKQCLHTDNSVNFLLLYNSVYRIEISIELCVIKILGWNNLIISKKMQNKMWSWILTPTIFFFLVAFNLDTCNLMLCVCMPLIELLRIHTFICTATLVLTYFNWNEQRLKMFKMIDSCLILLMI